SRAVIADREVAAVRVQRGAHRPVADPNLHPGRREGPVVGGDAFPPVRPRDAVGSQPGRGHRPDHGHHAAEEWDLARYHRLLTPGACLAERPPSSAPAFSAWRIE